MPTARQKKVARLIIKNANLDKPLNDGQIVEKSRYSHSMVIKPSKVIQSKGVQEVLTESGFTEDNAKNVVGEIMLNPEVEPNARLKATDQVFKVEGSYAPEKNIIQGHFLHSTLTSKKAQEIADKYEAEVDKLQLEEAKNSDDKSEGD